MNKVLRTFVQKIGSNKLIAAFLLVTTVTALGMSSVASAHRGYPRYFDVEKPTSQSVCYGGSWDWEWDWSWHHWHWSRHKIWFWTPNWERLGFESRAHCLNYVTTPKPTSRQDCRQGWWHLGFLSNSQCKRYLRLHPGGGYDGDDFWG